MDLARERRILELCREAANLERQERDDWLRSEVGDDPGIMAEIHECLALMDVDELSHPLDQLDRLVSEEGMSVGDSLPNSGGTAEMAPVLLGRRIGPYVLARELGRGGMGTVFLGLRDDDELKMSVAVKLIQAKLATPELVEDFRRERQLLADLKHPHIAVLLDAGTISDGYPYFIMEYIEGQTIEKWCTDQAPSLRTLLVLFRKIVSAVGFAHAAGIVHRDIKPGNLMVTGGRDGTDPEPKLLDFGIAAFSHELEGRTGFSPMTPEYASPEQRMGRPVSQTTDIYALGLVLLQLLCGVSPSNMEPSPQKMISRLMSEGRCRRSTMDRASEKGDGDPPDGFETAAEAIPEALGYVLRTATSREPAQRYPTAERMIHDLDRVLAILPNRPGDTDVEKRHDAVIWYDPDERRAVAQLVNRLREASSLQIWYDVERVGSEDDPLTSMMTAMDQTHTCIVCLGPTGQEPWFREPAIRDALAFRADDLRVLPVLLPGGIFPEKQTRLPMVMRGQAWTTFPDGFDEEGISRLLGEVREVRLGTEAPKEPTGVCPFRGLEVFREQDAGFFHGRESVVQRVLQKAKQERFCAVLGPSGSGKSSIVQAGAVPVLRSWGRAILLLTPTQHPVEELAFGLHKLFDGTELAEAPESLGDRLRQDPEAVAYIGREWMAASGGRALCLVVDQFEEIFSLAHDHTEIATFVDLICRAVDAPEGSVSVLVTMRSDFLGKCAAFPGLNHHFTENSLLVPPMKREDCARAIVAPARAAGLRLETGLLERILDDVGGRSGDLPLLEHALLELYERRRVGTLHVEAYDEIGGIQGALTKRADAEYRDLTEEARETLRKMFVLCLIQPGEGTRDTRRRATREELLSVGATTEVVETLLRRWTEARLLTAFRDVERKRDYVDVALEALLASWQPIATWMAEDRETARQVGHLRRNAKLWDESGRSTDLLPRGGPLYQMKDLVERERAHLGDLERTFVAEGVALAERKARAREVAARRMRLRRNQAFIATGIALFLAGLAFFAFLRADREKRQARAAQVVAESQRLESNLNLAHMYDQKSQVALEEGHVSASWLYSLAALSLELPPAARLPAAVGRLNQPDMVDAGRLLWTTPSHKGVQRSGFSPDGRFLALAGNDFNIHFLDLEHGRPAGVLQGHRLPIRALAFAPANRPDVPSLLASASDDRKVLLWRLPDGSGRVQRPEVTLDHGEPVVDVAFTSGGRFLVSLDKSGTLRIWSLENGHWVSDRPRIVPPRMAGPATALAVSRDGRQVAWASAGGALVVEGLATPGTVHIETDGPERVVDVVALKDSWVVAYRDGILRQYRDDGSIRREIRLELPGGPVALEPFSEEEHVIVLGAGGDLELWDLTAGTSNARWTPFSGIVRREHGLAPLRLLDPALGYHLAVHPEHRWVSVTCGDWVLWDASLARPQARLSGHGSHLSSVALSPDGQLLATGSSDNQARIWDLATGRPLVLLSGHIGPVSSLSFSPDNQLIATACMKGLIKLWKVPEGELLATLELPDSTVLQAPFSPDGTLLAAAGSSGAIELWSVADALTAFAPPGTDRTLPKDLHRTSLQGHDTHVFDLAFTPDGGILASSSGDRTVVLWDLERATPRATLSGHMDDIWDVAFARNGRWLASVSDDGTLRIWDVAKGQSVQTLTYSGPLESVAFSRDGTTLAAGGVDRVIHLAALIQKGDGSPEWHPRARLAGHDQTVIALDFSADGKLLLSGSEDGTAKIWNLGEPSLPKDLDYPFDRVLDLAVSRNGAAIAVLDQEERVTLWHRDREPHSNLLSTLDGGALMSFDFSPDERLFAAAFRDGSVRSWRVADGRELPRPKGHPMSAFDVAFSPDSQTLASSAHDGIIKLWDVATGLEPTSLVGHQTQQVHMLRFLSQRNYLVSACLVGELIVWDLSRQEIVAKYYDPRNFIYGVACSPDERTIAIGHADGTIQLWDIDSRQVRATLVGHRRLVAAVDFLAEGRQLVSYSLADGYRLWDLESQQTIARFRQNGAPYTFHVTLPGQGGAVAGTEEGFLRIWDLERQATFHRLSGNPEILDSLLQKSLVHFGYQLDGEGLTFAPRYRLEGIGPFRDAYFREGSHVPAASGANLDLLDRLLPVVLEPSSKLD